ncbi:amidohydrolase family protein [Hippea alviniae]|uniref:amidohydrolase family protein n=1 Tax=Hippea alviniae TaxID=1279027 RepID=UPI0003B4F83A|nr:amidohydrolase family protein [Hippea alviniae]
MKVLLSDYIFDGERLLRDKAVVVNSGVVVDIDNFKIIRKAYPEVEVKEFFGGVLFPGFVNAHVHLELGYLKGKTKKSKGFVEWLKSIMAAKSEDENVIRESIKSGIDELLKSGVGLVGDISNTLLSVEYLDIHMPQSVVFYENYSLNRKRACDVVEKLRSKRLLSKSVHISVVIHAVYSTHPCLAEFVCSLDDALFSIHFLESEFENQFLRNSGELFDFLEGVGLVSDRFYFDDVWDFLENTSCLKRNTIFVHCVEAKNYDLERIKELNGTVCLCLKSNEFISSKLPDVYGICASGVNIAFGTDSLASNDNLNFLEELRFTHKSFPLIEPEKIFSWSISGGAKALGVKWGFYKGAFCKPVFISSKIYSPLAYILEEKGEGPLIINA